MNYLIGVKQFVKTEKIGFLKLKSTFLFVLVVYFAWVTFTTAGVFLLGKGLVVNLIFFPFYYLIMKLLTSLSEDVSRLKLVKEGISFKDKQKLLIYSLWIWIPINYILGGSPYIFTLLVLAIFLLYKNFFQGPLTVLPLFFGETTFFLSILYMLSVFSREQGIDIFALNNILLSLIFWTPYIARKSSTYGKQYKLGPVKSAMLATISMFVQMLTLVYLTQGIIYGQVLTLGIITMYCLYFMVFAIYMLTLKDDMVHKLQQTTDAYIVFSLVLFLVVCAANLVV